MIQRIAETYLLKKTDDRTKALFSSEANAYGALGNIILIFVSTIAFVVIDVLARAIIMAAFPFLFAFKIEVLIRYLAWRANTKECSLSEQLASAKQVPIDVVTEFLCFDLAEKLFSKFYFSEKEIALLSETFDRNQL